MTLVAGVDSSTQSVKVVVCDLETGSVVRTARASHPDATEVPASAWLAAYQQAAADPALLDGVSALAVGGQQHGMHYCTSTSDLSPSDLLGALPGYPVGAIILERASRLDAFSGYHFRT